MDLALSIDDALDDERFVIFTVPEPRLGPLTPEEWLAKFVLSEAYKPDDYVIVPLGDNAELYANALQRTSVWAATQGMPCAVLDADRALVRLGEADEKGALVTTDQFVRIVWLKVPAEELN